MLLLHACFSPSLPSFGCLSVCLSDCLRALLRWRLAWLAGSLPPVSNFGRFLFLPTFFILRCVWEKSKAECNCSNIRRATKKNQWSNGFAKKIRLWDNLKLCLRWIYFSDPISQCPSKRTKGKLMLCYSHWKPKILPNDHLSPPWVLLFPLLKS